MRFFLVVPLLLLAISQPAYAAISAGCDSIMIRNREDYLYVDPSPIARVRIGASEAAMRVSGPFDSDNSIFEKMAEGSSIHLIGKRKILSGTAKTEEHVVLELLAQRSRGKLIWALLYNGDYPNSAQQVMISNLKGAVQCESSPGGRGILDFKGLTLNAGSAPIARSVQIDDAELAYKMLGL